MDKYRETCFSYYDGRIKVVVMKEDGEHYVLASGKGWKSTLKIKELDAAMNEAMKLINDKDDDEDK